MNFHVLSLSWNSNYSNKSFKIFPSPNTKTLFSLWLSFSSILSLSFILSLSPILLFFCVHLFYNVLDQFCILHKRIYFKKDWKSEFQSDIFSTKKSRIYLSKVVAGIFLQTLILQDSRKLWLTHITAFLKLNLHIYTIQASNLQE